MENSESQLEDIKELFKRKDVQILWFSCLEDYKLLPALAKKWEIHPRLPYKHHRRMFKLNLIDERQPEPPKKQGRKLPNIEIKSKVEWLSGLIKDMVKNEMFLDKLELVFGSTDLAIQHVGDVANSEAFRKGVMNSNLLANTIKKHREYILKWSPSQKKTRKGLGSELLPRWEALIINGLVCLSLFKAFRSDDRCLKYFKSPPLFFNPLIIIPSFDFLACYQSFQAGNKYGIPEQIKPYFTYHKLVEEVANNIRELKVACPDLWRDAIRKVNSY